MEFNIESSISLYVPKGTKELYEKTEGWKNFSNIIEFEISPDGNDSGRCGENTTYIYEKATKTLTISGTGKIERRPWNIYKDDIQKVVIEKGVESIGEYVFGGCGNVVSVTIPSSVDSIGFRAFEGCESLYSLDIPYGVTYIDYGSFSGCVSLKSINLPNSLKYLGGAFSQCKSLTSLVIPNSVTDCNGIGDGCTGLKSITLGSGLTNWSEELEECFNLVSVTSFIEEPRSFSNKGYTFNAVRNATLYVPKGTKELYESTEGWKDFAKIIEIDSDPSIYADYGMCGENVIYTYNDTTRTLTIFGTGKMYDYNSGRAPWFEYRDSIQNVVIKDSVENVGENAFLNCSNLISVNISSSVKFVGERAFWFCSNLSDLKISDGVETIGAYAFAGCSSLKSIEIGKSIKNIENYAFGRNGSFTLRLSGYGIWSGVCPISKVLNKIVWRAKEYKASCDAFALYSNQITDFQFGDEVTVIPSGLCNGMSNLRTISIPSSVVNIGSMAFYGCTDLKSVLIPDGVAYIGDYAFGNCRRLASVNIPRTLTEIEPGTFNGCINLSAINIPNNVTSIGDAAFAECDSLVSVVVPSSVTNVGSYAFGGCSQLRLLQFVSTVPVQLTSEIGIASQTKFVVPEESLDDYKKAWLEYYRPDVYTYLLIPLDGVMFTEKATLDSYAAAMQDIDKSTITSVCFYDNIDANLTVEKIQEGMNPNCLYYYYSDNALQGKNLVNLDGYSSEKIILSDANVFRCLIPFTAKKAQFTYTPSIWANGFSGWETLCLPFEVSAFKASEEGYISPILLGAYGDFWLRQFVGASSKALYFSSTLDGTMKANTPYLLAFPGSVMGNGHLQGQTITFLGKNVEFEANATAEVQRNDKVFVGNYDNVADDASGWILNSTGSDLITSSVVGDKPFRAYFRTEDDFADFNAAKALNISFVEDEETAIREIDDDRKAENELNIYSIDGTLIRKAENTSDGLNGLKKGTYIINRKKVMIR